ncbi:MAG: orotidine-5'-phosphate decarboxylase [Verrucomicrobia bacterium]|nr:orotidine-5'-phosphate decarboxylase [Verrucomicrobiota bacterium]
MSSDQVILALDVDTAEEALSWARRLRSRVGTCKVGLQLYIRAGTEVLRGLQKLDIPIFLDLKFHDIPNTVGQAVAAVAVWRPRFLTVHASGGRAMMEAAAASAPTETRVLGVTLLTSLNETSVVEIGWKGGVAETVQHLSSLARKAGLSGVVCSPHEAKSARSVWGAEAEIVTPGIRPPGAKSDDQARSKTAVEAIQEGASRIVIGRPVLRAANPEEVLDLIVSGKG